MTPLCGMCECTSVNLNVCMFVYVYVQVCVFVFGFYNRLSQNVDESDPNTRDVLEDKSGAEVQVSPHVCE